MVSNPDMLISLLAGIALAAAGFIITTGPIKYVRVISAEKLWAPFCFHCGAIGEAGNVTRIPKCCQLGEIYDSYWCEANSTPLILNFPNTTLREYEVVVAKKCDISSRIQIGVSTDFKLFSNGTLKDTRNMYPPEKYCLETYLNPNGTAEIFVFLCYSDLKEFGLMEIMAGGGCLISNPLLLVATISSLIYLQIRQRTWLHK